MFNQKEIDFFYSRVNKNGDAGCWKWVGGKSKGGYGKIKISGKPYRAHRLSYMIHKGDIPPGMFICHHCDNPECTNPEHLFLGTPAENSRDMVNKNRAAKPVGEKNNNAILTNKQVNQIRMLLIKNELTPKAIADLFNVSDGTIRLIDIGKAWTHVKMSNGVDFKSRRPRKTKFLSKKEVIGIKKILSSTPDITFPTIAKRFGVDRMTINRIATGDTWADVEIDLPDGGKYSYEKKSYKRVKISEQEVIKIKKMILGGELSYSEIAEEFPISRSTVGLIAVGKVWADVPVVLGDGSKFYHKRKNFKSVERLKKDKDGKYTGLET